MQCVTDLDCHAVGLLDGVCRDNVCQPLPIDPNASGPAEPSSAMAASAAGSRSSNSSGTGPTRGTTAVSSTQADAGAGATRVGSGSAANAGSQSSGSAITTGAPPGAMGEDSPASSNAAGSSAGDGSRPGMSCIGPNCDCSADADCEARGIVGGTCVEGHCWEPENQCTADADCNMRGPEFVGGRCQAKQCLPNPRFRCEPQPPASASAMTELVLPVIDALQLAPLADVKIAACNKLDLTCAQPINSATTGTDGKAKLTVPSNFAGYMQETERNDYVPAMYFIPPQLPVDGQLSNLPLVPSAAFSGLAVALGAQPDSTRGHAMLVAEDCKGTALPGIQFTSPQADKGTVAFYVRDQIPTSSVMDTPPEGDGGFANLPAGTVEIVATELKTGLVLNTVTVLVRAGFITTAYIRPASRGTTTTGRFPLGP